MDTVPDAGRFHEIRAGFSGTGYEN